MKINDSDAKSLSKQLLCSLVINLVSLLQGASVSTSSIILHELQNSSIHIQDSHSHFINSTSNTSSDIGPLIIFQDFHITQEEGSWIASSWVLGHLVSACFAGFISDAIGRKKSLLLDTAVFFLGFIILATGHLTRCLVLARALLGYPLVSQVYLCEIMSPTRRGLGAAMYSVLHALGFFLVLILGAFLPWRIAVTVPAILAIPTFIAITFLHESPEWLNKTGQVKKCEEALRFYHKELEERKNDIQIVEIEVKDNTTKRHAIFVLVENLNVFSKSILEQDQSFWRNFLYLAVLFTSVGWCGFSILSFYAVEVFQESGSPFSASNTSWITSITKIVCSVGAFYVLHTFERKTLFILTGILVFVSFLLMALFTYISSQAIFTPELITKFNFVPMVCVILAYIGYGLGYGVIPSLIAAEMMPVEIRSTVVGVLMTLEMTSTFLLSKLKPVLMVSLGIHGLFTMFAGSVFVVIILTVIAMPRHRM